MVGLWATLTLDLLGLASSFYLSPSSDVQVGSQVYRTRIVVDSNEVAKDIYCIASSVESLHHELCESIFENRKMIRDFRSTRGPTASSSARLALSMNFAFLGENVETKWPHFKKKNS